MSIRLILFINILIINIFFVYFTLSFAHAQQQILTQNDLPHRVTIRTDKASLPFQVKIANTPSTRAQGLQYVRTIPDNGGMLFVFARNTQATFWMKNTPLSLDIIFIDKQGIIKKIIPHTVPYSTAHLKSDVPVSYVLEVKAGTAQSLDIKAGHKVIFSDTPLLKAEK